MYWRAEHDEDIEFVEADEPQDASKQAFGDVPDHRILVRRARPEELLQAAAVEVEDVGSALREARNELGLSRYELGRRFGFPVQEYERANGSTQRNCRTWANWERGQTEPGRDGIQHLQAIADAIREARDDQGKIDWDHLRSGLSARIDAELPPETG